VISPQSRLRQPRGCYRCRERRVQRGRSAASEPVQNLPYKGLHLFGLVHVLGHDTFDLDPGVVKQLIPTGIRPVAIGS
jgi:hypothetical protein